MDKKKKIIIGIGSVAFVMMAYFVFEYFMYVETDNAQVQAHTVLIAAKTPGYILKVNSADGLKVKRNDVLIQIDDRDYKAALEAAKSEVLSLEARKIDAEKNYNRLKDLYSKSVVSQQQYDTSRASYNEIKARYDSAVSRVVQSQINYDYTQIKAPSNGIIAKSSAEVGQLASPGMALVGFVSSEDRWIIANFKETDIGQIKVGAPVEIKIDALSGEKYEGEVESISSATGSTFTLLPPDNATGNFTKVVQRVPVKIKIKGLNEEVNDRIQAGLSAVVKVKLH